jgi:hypothetical protein
MKEVMVMGKISSMGWEADGFRDWMEIITGSHILYQLILL